MNNLGDGVQDKVLHHSTRVGGKEIQGLKERCSQKVVCVRREIKRETKNRKNKKPKKLFFSLANSQVSFICSSVSVVQASVCAWAAVPTSCNDSLVDAARITHVVSMQASEETTPHKEGTDKFPLSTLSCHFFLVKVLNPSELIKTWKMEKCSK